MSHSLSTATFGGGCFWCIEAIFEQLRGVEGVVSGYAGGKMPNPTYDQVCSGSTGHAEVIQVAFEPSEITFRELLEIFFTLHDPTTKNRQGADIGTQYRSIVLYHDDEQRRITEDVIREFDDAQVWDNPIVTNVEPFHTFYPAEDYHQAYYRNHAQQPYCQVVIAPKVAKLRQKFLARLKTAPQSA
jgi:peptide-methionine (S)-S-oxide reductase